MQLNNRKEESLLMYLETRQVDYGGAVDTSRMNEEEIKIAQRWAEEGWLEFGRICYEDCNRGRSHWVKLSGDAFALAHVTRIARAERAWKARRWRTTAEYREEE
jgi:hypothetical protein